MKLDGELLCRIWVHDWVYSHSYDPEARICLRCSRVEFQNVAHPHSSRSWRTDTQIERSRKRHKIRTFEEMGEDA